MVKDTGQRGAAQAKLTSQPEHVGTGFDARYSIHGDVAASRKLEKVSGTLRSRQLNKMNSLKC